MAVTEALEMRISRALEAPPAVQIPDDFAARLAARLPARLSPTTPPATYYAKHVSMVCAALLLLGVVVLAPHTAGGSAVWLTLQCLLCAQLVGVLVWLRAFSQ